MPRPRLLQISDFFQFYAGLSSVTASGTSTVVTSALTTAANTAGRSGSSVPVQQSSSTQMGYVTTGRNKCLVFDSSTKEYLKDASNNRVYGRLTFASTVYTVSYFTLVGSTETAFTMASTVDILVPYFYEVGNLPEDFAVRVSQSYASDDLGSISGGSTPVNTFAEVLTVSGTNTIGALTKVPFPASAATLYVNNIAYDALSGGGVSLSGTGNKTVTWSSANAGFSVLTSDRVVAVYPTQE